MDEQDPGTGEDGGVSAQGRGWRMYAKDAGRGGASRRTVMSGGRQDPGQSRDDRGQEQQLCHHKRS